MLKWIGTIACSVGITGCVASFLWSFGYLTRDRYWAVEVWRGTVAVDWSEHARLRNVSRQPLSAQVWLKNWEHEIGSPWWPEAVLMASMSRVTVPLWIPLLAVAIPSSLLWYRDRRTSPGRCQRCGYDLTGLPESRCPECGTAFEHEEDAA